MNIRIVCLSLALAGIAGCGGTDAPIGNRDLAAGVPDADVEILEVTATGVQHENSRFLKSAIRDDDKLILVDFWAAWCGPCKAMNPELETLKKRWGDKLVILKIDVDAPENRQLAMHMQISSIPALLICRNGKILNGLMGGYTADELDQELRFVQ
jgi:thioredoxin 1